MIFGTVQKNLSKKITKAGKTKEKCRLERLNQGRDQLVLRFAIPRIVAKWKGVLHHVTGVHQWVMGRVIPTNAATMKSLVTSTLNRG